jgi:dihydroorotate dehydrogenase electron transfer subunit
MGETGLVTLPLDRQITQLKLKHLAFDLFACGPDGMLKAVGQRAIEHNMKGWLSLDKHMVCGVGACLACIQKLRKEDGTEWTGRVCRDGPIFESREIVW